MLGFLYRFFVGSFKVTEPHRCEWEKIDEVTLNTKQYWQSDFHKTGIIYVLRCKNCGDIKQHKISG